MRVAHEDFSLDLEGDSRNIGGVSGSAHRGHDDGGARMRWGVRDSAGVWYVGLQTGCFSQGCPEFFGWGWQRSQLVGVAKGDWIMD